MSKIKGRGGWLKKGAVAQSSIKSFTYSESEGSVYGQKQCDIQVETYVDSSTIPYRQGDTIDLELGHPSASWTIIITDCWVENAKINFSGGEAVTQSVTFVGRVKATIA